LCKNIPNIIRFVVSSQAISERHIVTEKALERKIKKNIYGLPQSALAVFPPGFGTVALEECQRILAHPWLSTQLTPELTLLKNEIRLDNIHLFALMELLLRSQTLTDLRLIIFAGKVSGKKAFEKKCRDIPWELYIDADLSIKIKVDSVASRAFHETGLKTILCEILALHAGKIVSGENSQENTAIYAYLYHDKLTVSISLAGDYLYKRGYRSILSTSAPLREDAAACCLRKCLQFARQYDPNYFPETLLVPFSGTGTFAFEYLQMQFHFIPGLFNREYAIQKMPFFRQASFAFLLKKAKEHSEWGKTQPTLRLVCIDHSQTANAALEKNKQLFVEGVERNGFTFPTEILAVEQKDFFSEKFLENALMGNIFMPLNPPYGIRLGKHANSVTFYKKIATKINEISLIPQNKKNHLTGFILCPSQETWSAFRQTLVRQHDETYHFTQGGMDIRVCQFFI